MGLTGILRDASDLGWKESGWKSSGHDVDIPRFQISRTGRRVAYGKNKFFLRYSGPGTLRHCLPHLLRLLAAVPCVQQHVASCAESKPSELRTKQLVCLGLFVAT
jgi:hypothetical protein